MSVRVVARIRPLLEKELDKDVPNENLRKPKSVIDLTGEDTENHTPAPHPA